MIKHNLSTKNIRVSACDKTNWADAGAPYLLISPWIGGLLLFTETCQAILAIVVISRVPQPLVVKYNANITNVLHYNVILIITTTLVMELCYQTKTKRFTCNGFKF